MLVNSHQIELAFEYAKDIWNIERFEVQDYIK